MITGLWDSPKSILESFIIFLKLSTFLVLTFYRNEFALTGTSNHWSCGEWVFQEPWRGCGERGMVLLATAGNSEEGAAVL